jgi:holo-[acyl-carrier protein] synthase
VTTGAGTDIVSVARVARLVERGPRFLERWFTADEIAYCSGKERPSLHFAGHLAAKEAVFKALHASSEGPVPWRHIEIGHDPDGAPAVRLSGSVLEAATRDGVGRLCVSLSHCDEFATAVAIADG